MSDIKICTEDMFELRNPRAVPQGEDPPTLLLEAGTWNTGDGQKSGISVSAFGEFAPLIEPRDAKRLAKWLEAAADLLSGEKKKNGDRRGPKKRRDDEDDDFEY